MLLRSSAALAAVVCLTAMQEGSVSQLACWLASSCGAAQLSAAH